MHLGAYIESRQFLEHPINAQNAKRIKASVSLPQVTSIALIFLDHFNQSRTFAPPKV